MTPEQCRAGRDLLGWSLGQLATATTLSYETVRGYEAGRPARPSTVSIIRATLEATGVEFIPENGDGIGVRMRKSAVQPGN